MGGLAGANKRPPQQGALSQVEARRGFRADQCVQHLAPFDVAHRGKIDPADVEIALHCRLRDHPIRTIEARGQHGMTSHDDAGGGAQRGFVQGTVDANADQPVIAFGGQPQVIAEP